MKTPFLLWPCGSIPNARPRRAGCCPRKFNPALFKWHPIRRDSGALRHDGVMPHLDMSSSNWDTCRLLGIRTPLLR